jgi:hypothetical protein
MNLKKEFGIRRKQQLDSKEILADVERSGLISRYLKAIVEF